VPLLSQEILPPEPEPALFGVKGVSAGQELPVIRAFQVLSYSGIEPGVGGAGVGGAGVGGAGVGGAGVGGAGVGPGLGPGVGGEGDE